MITLIWVLAAWLTISFPTGVVVGCFLHRAELRATRSGVVDARPSTTGFGSPPKAAYFYEGT